ncbi:MAG: penicillin-binding protein 1C [Treponema sp.]|nr:penicillin-binding protein 1C [Treponema sp.]
MKKIVFVFLGIFILLLLGFLTLRFSPYPALQSFQDRRVSSRIYDCEGDLIQILALEDGIRREFTPIKDIPPFIQQAFISAEDRHFYSHHGIDFLALFRALFQNASQGRTVSGASTITMQLAKIIGKNQKRNIFSKINEAFNALRLETRLSKEEILELYLNNLPFGFNTEGITSGAKTFFSKELSQITEIEAYCLSVIPRRPSFYNPLTNPQNCSKSAWELYSAVSKEIKYSEKDFLAASLSAKSFTYPFECPHFVRYLASLEDSPLGKDGEIHTSLSLNLQKKAESLLHESVARYQSYRLTNGAILVCHNQTGEILAWVGSADFFNEENQGQVDGILTARQPGSSMKPFLYALALERGFSPSSVLPDIPMEFGFENLYLPQNFNNRFNGPVRFRVALASSLNVPAVYLLNEIGLSEYQKKLSDLGFYSLEESNPGLSLALGGAEVSIFEMTRAFSVFARDGYFINLHALREKNPKNNEEKGKKVFDVNTARIICDILSDKEERALGFGFSQTFFTPFPAMFKTGTANQYQNITAFASTPQYTVGVWMGNFSGETVVGKTGSSIPASLAKELLIYLQGNKGQDFQKPAQFKKEKICALSGMKAGPFCSHCVTEYVSQTDLQRESCSWHTENGVSYPSQYSSWFHLKNRKGLVKESTSPLKIISPRSGSLFYYDPSIPPGQQKLIVEASGGQEEKAIFYLDEEIAGESGRPFLQKIPLTKGRHKIHIVSGQEKDEIFITVK